MYRASNTGHAMVQRYVVSAVRCKIRIGTSSIMRNGTARQLRIFLTSNGDRTKVRENGQGINVLLLLHKNTNRNTKRTTTSKKQVYVSAHNSRCIGLLAEACFIKNLTTPSATPLYAGGVESWPNYDLALSRSHKHFHSLPLCCFLY